MEEKTEKLHSSSWCRFIKLHPNFLKLDQRLEAEQGLHGKGSVSRRTGRIKLPLERASIQDGSGGQTGGTRNPKLADDPSGSQAIWRLI